MITELKPVYDSRASFYGKAQVEILDNGNKVLRSYCTVVASITADGEVKLHDLWDSSSTTLRHVKEFLLQNNKKAGSKKEIAKLYA